MQASGNDLARRMDELEQKVAGLSRRNDLPVPRGLRKRASWGVGALPFYDIAIGPDPERGEVRGHARGIIAIGDIATGVLAVGGLARGVFAFGGLALGVVGFGGLCISLLLAMGGLAVGPIAAGGAALGGVAIGGGAVGGIAIGGGAVGYYACGGGSTGQHFTSAAHRDARVLELLREYGLDGLCPIK